MFSEDLVHSSPTEQVGYNVAGTFWSALAAGISSAINSYGDYKIQQSVNRSNRNLAEYEWGQNVDMWHAMNAYNTPASQMARYREAGLNPNLMYQQGNSGNAASSPTYRRPTMQASRLTSFEPAIAHTLQMFSDVKVKQAQANNIAEQSNLIAKQAITEETRNKNLDLQGKLFEKQAERYGYDLDFDRDRRSDLLTITQQDAKRASLDREFQERTLDDRIKIINEDALMKEFQRQLRQFGVMDADPFWMRVISRLFGSVTEGALSRAKVDFNYN